MKLILHLSGMRSIILAYLLLSLNSIGSVYGQQIHMVTNTSDSGLGSLRQAVLNSSTGDTIKFSPSLLSNGSDTIKLLNTIQINHSLTILGLFQNGDSLCISGSGLKRIFYLQGAINPITPRFFFKDLILQDGTYIQTSTSGSRQGGAVAAMYTEKLSFENVIFRDNQNVNGGLGGALHLYENDTVSFKNCTFKNNSYSSTGGAVFQRGGVLQITNSSFLSNGGRALMMSYGKLFIKHSYFEGNSGGAISLSSLDTAFFNQSEFLNNSASSGGAIYTIESNLAIHNSYFKGNYANTGGGLIVLQA